MIKKRIAALAIGAALATSAIIAPQASADTKHHNTHTTHGKWHGEKKGKHHKKRHENKRQHHNKKGHDNYKHHRGSSLSSW